MNQNQQNAEPAFIAGNPTFGMCQHLNKREEGSVICAGYVTLFWDLKAFLGFCLVFMPGARKGLLL